ncbi:hypothetical protein L6452_40197 [Arctium lappa]|uniref:Uncharacterized protein n=1 Tax=Arctium lappa TaxID=4217 RepID=A0ACB8XLV2_ARCLA|nr:hypothetical protein L6452_40197 [Arctium lappa]
MQMPVRPYLWTEVALDVAKNGRQNAETESALTKEKVELSKLELKRTVSYRSLQLPKVALDQMKQQQKNVGNSAWQLTVRQSKLYIEALQKELQKTKEKLQAIEELKKQSEPGFSLEIVTNFTCLYEGRAYVFTLHAMVIDSCSLNEI